MSASEALTTTPDEAELTAGGKASWYAPLSLPKLYLLILATVGAFSFVYVYQVARDLRDHVDENIRPILYPFSIPIGFIAAIAGARLARTADGALQARALSKGAAPSAIGWLIFLSNVLLGAADLVPWTSLFVAGALMYPLPWLLLQGKVNRLKARESAGAFRSPANRFSWWQIGGMAVGALVWMLIGFGAWSDVLRFRGDALIANRPYVDPEKRFVILPPGDGWVAIAPGHLTEDAVFEALGPQSADWAVVHVNDDPTFTIDDTVEFRYGEVEAAYGDVVFEESRVLLPQSEIPISYSSYRGLDPLEGRFSFDVATFADNGRVVEFIVHTSGARYEGSRGQRFAQSLRPFAGAPEVEGR